MVVGFPVNIVRMTHQSLMTISLCKLVEWHSKQVSWVYLICETNLKLDWQMERFLRRSSNHSTREERSSSRQKPRPTEKLRSLARRTGLFEFPGDEKNRVDTDEPKANELSSNFGDEVPAIFKSSFRDEERDCRRRTLTRGMSEAQLAKRLDPFRSSQAVGGVEQSPSYAQLSLSRSDSNSVCSVQSERVPIKRSASIGASRQLSRRDIFFTRCRNTTINFTCSSYTNIGTKRKIIPPITQVKTTT